MESVRDEKSSLRYIFRMLRFMKPHTIPYSIGLFLTCTQSFLINFILSVMNSNIMAAIVSHDVSLIYRSVIVLLVMFLGYFLVVMPGLYLFYINGAKGVRNLKRDLFREFIRNSLDGSTLSHSGEGIAAINTDANTASEIFGFPLRVLLVQLINIAFSAIVVFVVDWRLGAATICVALLAFFIQRRFTGPVARISTSRLDAYAGSVKTISNIFSGAIAIRTFNMQAKSSQAFDHDNETIRVLDYKRAFISMWQSLFTTVQGWLTIVVVFGLGGWLVATGRLELHKLMMIPVMSMTITSSCSLLGTAIANLQAPIAGAVRVFRILGDDKAEIEYNKTAESTHPDGYRLQINGLDFTYKGADKKTLQNITLEIGENQMVAFVGESGSGKSTLLRAIIGMYERDDLRINLGDKGFNAVDIRDWRKSFAYVDQSCKLFDMSVMENIALGKPGEALDDEIITASKRAAAHDFIISLEGGYSAPCGEKGDTLSGGQKQRIAIARALLRGAPILVFDEATSALDKDSERSIMETINSLRKDHTILITTHKLDNTIGADKIVVLSEGEIAEVGSHDDLIALGGFYSRLFSEATHLS